MSWAEVDAYAMAPSVVSEAHMERCFDYYQSRCVDPEDAGRKVLVSIPRVKTGSGFSSPPHKRTQKVRLRLMTK